MGKKITLLSISLLFAISIIFIIGCKKENPEVISLDVSEIKDKSTHSGSLIVSFSTFKNAGWDVYLNQEKVTMDKPLTITPGFYMLLASDPVSDQHKKWIRFVVLDPHRGETEWGLPEWTPKTHESTGEVQELSIIYPQRGLNGIVLPIILHATNSKVAEPVFGECSLPDMNRKTKMKHGWASLVHNGQGTDQQVSITYPGGTTELDFTKHTGEVFELSDTLKLDHIYQDVVLKIKEDLIIPENTTWQIGEGTLVLISEGVNIFNEGHIIIQGRPDNPILFTAENNEGLWGGFISSGNTNSMALKHAIFSRSGHHTSSDYQYGHAKRQALFFLDNTNFDMDSCYMVDNAGQIVYSLDANINIKGSYLQGAISAGQVNSSEVTISNSVFTDFPDDKLKYQDKDNDALYINNSNATIRNSIFMYTSDDGIDSGASGGGEVNIENCHFEAIFHEGLALSSGGEVAKTHRIKNTTFTNCGQGVELGYSSPNHTVLVDSCLFHENLVGIRYGDNYENVHRGLMLVSNSTSRNNYYHDVWNMLRETWTPWKEGIAFSNTKVSKPDTLYPELIITPN